MRTLASDSAIDLTVYFCSRHGLDKSYDPEFGAVFRWDTPLLEGYRSTFLPNVRKKPAVEGFFSLINPGIVQELIRHKFDVILVHGYEHCTKWLAFVGARLSGARVILRGDSNMLTTRPYHIRIAKNLIVRPLLSTAWACAYIGSANRDYLRHYGVPDARLFFAPYAVDNDFFQTQDRLLRPRRRALRAALGVPDGVPIILACGKLIALKQPLHLLHSFAETRRRLPCALVYVGDGSLRSEIERVVRSQNIPDVHITGFVNQGKISEMYVAADLLVLPSSVEAWGLVVNEAMNFGLPIIATDRVGCAADLVRPDENGFIVGYHNDRALTDALEVLVRDDELRDKFGQRSREIVADYSMSACARAIVSAARRPTDSLNGPVPGT